MSSQGTKPALSISALRTLILIALVAGLSVFTGVMFTLVQNLSDRFGPQVQADLEWRAERGAQELAKTADLGLAVSDTAMVKDSFGVYAKSSDVQAIIAVDAAGKLVAQHGEFPFSTMVFAGKENTLVGGPGYLASWAPAVIEGNVVGKIAVVVSTKRMIDASSSLYDVKRITVSAGAIGLVLGVIVILFFTRAVAQRDRQLGDYAANLEKKVDERTKELDERNRGMRLVLDNVAQGFITIDPDGVMAPERSAIVETWFGAIAPDTKFSAVLAGSGDFSTWFELGLDSLRDGLMPVELSVDQMPKRFVRDGKTFDVGYSPILNGEQVQRILLIVSDVTAEIERERTEREQREIVELFQRISSDRAGFDEFVSDASDLVEKLKTSTDPVVEKRLIHTLKGNCGVYGIHSYAALCHEIETELGETGAGITEVQRERLVTGWTAVTERLATLRGERKRTTIEIEQADLVKTVERARQGISSRELASDLASWLREPVAVRFERLGRQATNLARRLGKGEIAVAIEDQKIRLDADRWQGFWASMIHAVRNAVDHGVEAAEERERAGKPPVARISLGARHTESRLEITLQDDGRGIDWEAVARKAERLGLPHGTPEDLVAVLFHDGFSTRDQATDTSGRGVGLGALRDTVLQAGGTIAVTSHLGMGTTFRFVFPSTDDVIRLRPPTQPIRKVS